MPPAMDEGYANLPTNQLLGSVPILMQSRISRCFQVWVLIVLLTVCCYSLDVCCSPSLAHCAALVTVLLVGGASLARWISPCTHFLLCSLDARFVGCSLPTRCSTKFLNGGKLTDLEKR
jgi:hypothetical protein